MKKFLLITFILLLFQNIISAQDAKDEMYYKRQIQNQRFLYSNAGLVNAMKKKNLTAVEAFMKAGFNPNDTYAKTPFLIYSIYFNSPEELNVPVEEQAAVVDKYAKENLSAEKAAENGYIDDVVSEEELRDTLADAWNLLSNKRVQTESKKHATI